MSCWQLAIDWPAIGSVLSGAAALTLAATGAWGIATWRSTNFRKGQYEAAVFSVESAMAYGELLRQSAEIFRGRDFWEKVPRHDNETEQDWIYRRHYFAPQVIFNSQPEVNLAMRQSIHRSRAWLDQGTAHALKELYDYQYTIYDDFNSAWLHSRNLLGAERADPKDHSRVEELYRQSERNVAHLLGATVDGKQQKSGIDIRITELENSCSALLSPHLKGPAGFWQSVWEKAINLRPR